MLTLEDSTRNIIYTKGLFAIPPEAFQFNWDILNRIFVSTLNKFERYCPLCKTLVTVGNNPTKMPDDCIYPKAVAFGNNSMIMPQTAAVDSQSWSYDRATKLLSVFTKTGSVSNIQVQYLAKRPSTILTTEMTPFQVFEDESLVNIQLDFVPNLETIYIAKGNSELTVTSRARCCATFEGDFGSAILDLNSLSLQVTQTDTSEGYIDISYDNKYPAYELISEDQDFFELWYAANILTSLGNIKAIVNLDEMPNSISADDLISQGKELMSQVIEGQKERQYWWKGYLGSKV